MSITLFASMFRRQHPHVMYIVRTHARFMATSTILQSPSEHRVILDNQTLYVNQSLAEALGWKPEQGSDAGIKLSLSGWGPTYFTIAPTGSESGESQCIDISIVLILLSPRSSCSRGSGKQSQCKSPASFRLFEGTLTGLQLLLKILIITYQ